MKIMVVAYKFGSEEEIGRHLGTYHYFIEMTRRLKQNGHEVMVVAPWLSFWKKGSMGVDGVKIFRYYPPLWNSGKWFFLSRPLRLWYMIATKWVVLHLDGRESWDAILVWQARETGYAVSQIASKLHAPFLFRQITAWRWHVERPLPDVLGRKKWYRIISSLGADRLLEPALQWILDRKKQQKFAREIYRSAKKILFVSRAAAEAGSDWAGVIEKVIDKAPDLIGNAANLIAQGRTAGIGSPVNMVAARLPSRSTGICVLNQR